MCRSRHQINHLLPLLHRLECGTDRNFRFAEAYVPADQGQILKGFEYPHLKFAVISESDIFSSKTVRKKKKKRYESRFALVREGVTSKTL